MTNEDLKPFCCPDPEKKNLAEPWTAGDFSYGCSGHILIRVPRLSDVPEGEGISLERVTPTFEKEPEAWFKVLPTAIEPENCPHCKGKGKIYTCPECEGEGEVCASTDFSEYDDLDCKTCGGDGQLSKEKWLEVMSHRIRRGPAKEEDADCERCFATGKVWPQTGEVYGNAYFGHSLLRLVSPLPGAEIGPFGELDAARFRFDGGDGIIMPKRKPYGE